MSHDLTGQWSGIFNYPHSNPPTSFEAALTDQGGTIAGTIAEPDLFATTEGAVVTASVDGRHSDGQVTFVKLYDLAGKDYDFVRYEGTVSTDGNEIDGRWDIPGVWSGTFLMIRAAAAVVAEEIEAAEEVDAENRLP
jgi:hypothetical protein